MPLSEREERLLTQIEHDLRAEDPRFTAHMSDSISRRRRRRRLRSGMLVTTAGFVLILIGVWHNTVWPGAVGFLIMVAGTTWATRRVHVRPVVKRSRHRHGGSG